MLLSLPPVAPECYDDLLQHNHQPLIMSPSILTVAEIEANILSCFDALSHVVDDVFPQSDSNIYHQVIMLNELATEKHIRWDDSSDKFQGTCREHNQKLPLTFTSKHELDLLCDALQDGQVHLPSFLQT